MSKFELDYGLFYFLSFNHTAVGVDEQKSLTIEDSGGRGEWFLRHACDDFISFAFLLLFELDLSSPILQLLFLLFVILFLYVLELYFFAVVVLLDIHGLFLLYLSLVSV